MVNYYKVLEVAESATSDEIKSRYKELTLQYHPDRNQGDQSKADKFVKIKDAYEQLSKASTRALHDAQLKAHRMAFTRRSFKAPKSGGTRPATNSQPVQSPTSDYNQTYTDRDLIDIVFGLKRRTTPAQKIGAVLLFIIRNRKR
ncbi:MAG: J domain-containing protein [Bacteroidetes bacterium]|nr:J domain-containing protein [Bacteroidota bacterium]